MGCEPVAPLNGSTIGLKSTEGIRIHGEVLNGHKELLKNGGRSGSEADFKGIGVVATMFEKEIYVAGPPVLRIVDPPATAAGVALILCARGHKCITDLPKN
jgi:hypothetical protein